MKSIKADFNIGENKGRKEEEKVIAEISMTKDKKMEIINDPKTQKLLDTIKQGEKDILNLIQEDIVSEMDISGLKSYVDPSLKFVSPTPDEIARKNPDDVLIFPNFTGGKYIGGKNYNFTRGKGIFVPIDVRDVLTRGGKILIK